MLRHRALQDRQALVTGEAMTLLYQILEALVSLFSQGELWLVVCLALLIGGSAYLFHVAHTPKTSGTWVVRKGTCPFCGHALFGTTRAYQLLDLLDTVAPESQYLCTNCDQEKVSELLSLLEDGR
jgi:hypothetical protein